MLGSVLASLITNIYSCIYHPEDIVSVFMWYNKYIKPAFEQFNTLFSGVRMIGIGFLVVTCLISLLDKVSAGDFSQANLFRYLLKFFILYVVLMNALTIFMDLLQLSSSLADALLAVLRSETSSSSTLNQAQLAESIDEHVGLVSTIGYTLLALIPYVISIAYTIVLGFFAASRLIEIVIRLALSPLVIGMSGLTAGGEQDAVRFIKRTAGVLFQVVVVVVISSAITFTHDALISNGTITDPVSVLDEESNTRTIDVSGDGVWIPARDRTDTEVVVTYTQDSTTNFIRMILDPDGYMVSVGLMISALVMVLKSRNLSTQLFA